MTPLAKIIRTQIARFGPMPVSDYMALCLLHPRHGYYTTRDPLGRDGDFTTAPEISQMFGELLGLMLVQSWIEQGRPTPFLLVEPGPGRGTLMADMLRAARAAVPEFVSDASICLIEASPALRAIQKIRLAEQTVSWVDNLSDLPDLPLFLIANEFLDALPVRQFLRAGAGWRERMIGLQGDNLCFGLAQEAPMAALNARLDQTPEGQLVEVCPAAQGIVSEIARRIGSAGGLAVVIDYGTDGMTGDSFQAVRAHESVDPLATPGRADLTAHVDFQAVRQAALGVDSDCRPAVSPLVSQGVLLERLGITARAQSLAKNLRGVARDSHIAAHRRLTHPGEMGNLFKALAIYPQGVTTPAGFREHDA